MGNFDETTSKNPLQSIQNQLKQLRVNTFLILSPGNKQFKDISKRLRLMFLSAGIPLLLLVVKWLNISAYLSFLDAAIHPLLIAFFLSVIAFIGTLWGLKFQLRKESYYSILHLSPLFVFSASTLILTLFPGELNRLYLVSSFIFATGLFMILYYIVLMSVNILNVNLFYVIPLSKLGESLHYMTVIASVFMLLLASFQSIYTAIVNNVSIVATIWAGVTILIVLISTIMTLFYYLPVVQSTTSLAVNIAIITLITAIFSFLFLPYVVLAAFVSGLVMYVLLGVIIHQSQNTFKIHVFLEYGLIYLLVIAAVLFIQ